MVDGNVNADEHSGWRINLACSSEAEEDVCYEDRCVWWYLSVHCLYFILVTNVYH